MVAPSVLRGGERPASGREAGQRAAHVALAQLLERAVAQLTDTLKRDAEHAPYEYACHEGNRGLANILSAARSEEKADK